MKGAGEGGAGWVGQGKVVTALAADPAGSRLLAGSRDYTLRMFDFNGMNSTMRSFRSLEPSEGYPVHALSWSPTGLPPGPPPLNSRILSPFLSLSLRFANGGVGL